MSMQIISDLHIHSKYSRAVSPQMTTPFIWGWAKRKGIELMATGDWTHPLWMREIKANLEEMGNGLLKLKAKSEKLKAEEENIDNKWEDGKKDIGTNPLFLLATEISSIYSQGGKLRRIHTLIWSPTIETADKINEELVRRGCKLMGDGRPIMGLSSQEVAELVLTIDPKCLIIPAHAWTPWFSLYGSQSGFDSIDECFGKWAKYIFAVETGLSSDPAMNWRIKELDRRSILSSSDAHSGPKLGREATVFDLEDLSFSSIRKAIAAPWVGDKTKTGENHVSHTLEFYPEEGKYHFTGHRNCGVKQKPEETRKKGVICSVCGKKLTIGVMHRVDQLAGRTEEELRIKNKELRGIKIKGIYSETYPNRPPFVSLVPLQEIIAEVKGGQPTSIKVQEEYTKLTEGFNGEFNVLLKADEEKIAKISGEKIAEGIKKVRNRDIFVDPGYDGVFGVVKIWGEKEKKEAVKDEKEQMSIF